MDFQIKMILIKKLFKLFWKRKLYKKPIFRNPKKLYHFITANPLKDTHPIALQVEVTSECNLKCEYCIHHLMVENDKPIGTMSMKQYIEILDRHKDTLILLHLQGQGEPFLHPQYAEMVKEAKKRGLMLLAFTNGTALNAKNRKMLLEADFDLLYLSFDMQDKEGLEKTRTGMSYDKVVHNYQQLVKERNEGNYSTILAVHAVIYKSNLNKLKDRIFEIDQLLKPDVIVPTSLAMPAGDVKDYTQWYTRVGLDKEMVMRLPDTVHFSKYTNSICISNREFYTARGLGICDKANFIYYRWDGTTSFCGERHTVDEDDPVTGVREAIHLMKKGIVPPQCKMCQYLPPLLFDKTMKESTIIQND